ncbi:MAG TPA: PIN domain-containing protein [Ktedonobacteraceae bacterium]|nr:PIN domain-containing protein [Ktedonobacteraceae bacterium]
MSTSYLLDSSVLILSIKHDTNILQRLSEAASLFVPTVALGELYYGAEHSSNVEKGLTDVDTLAQRLSVLNTDNTTAKVYGYIKHEQRMKGQMLPDNDLWIAATAIQYGLTLAARDHHFTWITGLSLEQW